MSGDLVDLGVEYGVIKKSGNSYSFGEIKLGTGREVAKKSLQDDKKLMAEIRKTILAAAKKKEAE